MLLGVVYHAALIYSFFGWSVSDPQTDDGLSVVVYLLHSFRMPAFFLISGYFSALLLERGVGVGYLKKRALRLGLPMLASLLTINIAIWHVTYGYQAGGLLEGLRAPQFVEQWSSNRIFAHLWFLQVLLALSVAHWLAKLVGLNLSRWAGRLPGWLLASLTPLAVVAIYALDAQGWAPRWLTQPGWLWPGLTTIGIFAPFFALGAVLRANPGHSLLRLNPARLLILGAAGALCAWLPATLAAHSGLWARVCELFSEAMLSMIGTLACLAVARRYWRNPSPFFQSLIGASYSVYLLHVLVVLAIGQYLLDFDWGAWLKFSVTLGSTMLIVFAAHHFVIARVGWLSLLFNGKRPRVDPPRKEPQVVNLPELNPTLLGD